MNVYLGGPIAGCNDDECKTWREEMTEQLSFRGFKAIDPMRRDYRGVEDESVNEIVVLDKIDIQNSDIVVAFCPKPSVGTSMEVFYAWALNKPVVCIVPDGAALSPWLKYHSTAVVDTLNGALAFIGKL